MAARRRERAEIGAVAREEENHSPSRSDEASSLSVGEICATATLESIAALSDAAASA
jgi:hypothetical protein